MPYRYISPDQKQRILVLLDHGLDLETIADIFGCSTRSIERWENNYERYGNVIPPRLNARGPRPSISADIANDIYELLRDDPSLYLDEIADWLVVAHDLDVPISTLDRAIRAMSLTRKRMKKAATERDEVERTEHMEYCRANLRASICIWTDESSYDERTVFRKYGRWLLGERAELSEPFRRGERWSILPALSINGYLAHRVVPDAVDGVEFFDFIVNEVVSHLKVCKLPPADSTSVTGDAAISK